MTGLFVGLVTIAGLAAFYAVVLWAKAHLDPRTRHQVAFVLTATVVAVALGGALLVAVIGRSA